MPRDLLKKEGWRKLRWKPIAHVTMKACMHSYKNAEKVQPGGPQGVYPNLDFDKDVNIIIDTNDPSGKKGCGSYSMSVPMKHAVGFKRR